MYMSKIKSALMPSIPCSSDVKNSSKVTTLQEWMTQVE